MPHTTSRFFDEMSKLVVGSVALAESLRYELNSVIKTNLDDVLQGFDLVHREEVDAVWQMVKGYRADIEDLRARVAALESDRQHCGAESGGCGESHGSEAQDRSQVVRGD